MDSSLRCKQCGKKLGANLKGEVEIVCPRCGHFNHFQVDITLESTKDKMLV